MKPSIGRIVHCVMKDGNGTPVHRPAIITNHWEGHDEMVNALVFLDALNDRVRVNPNVPFIENPSYKTTMDVYSIHHDEEKKDHMTWHWPEKVEE